MSNHEQKAFSAFMLSVLLLVTLLVTVALMGCGHSNKVSKEDDQIRALQWQLQLQKEFFTDLSNRMDIMQTIIDDLIANSAATAVQIAALEAEQNDLLVAQTAMQVQINGMLVQLAMLNGYTNIVGIIDVCNDSPGIVDEVLLKLSNGQYLASFSANQSGLNTRFSILPDGNYSSTDGSNCHFSLASGVLTW